MPINSNGDSMQSQDIESSAMASNRAHLLICSIGNPGVQYANTYHSAGHTILQRLAYELQYDDWRKDPELGGLTARTPRQLLEKQSWTLWQSPTVMNLSGRAVHLAHKAWAKTLPAGETGRLIVVHDELEKPTGQVTLKTNQGVSAKGHNGLKSIMEVFSTTKTPFFRLGIGIGRPVSRDRSEVISYVMAKMSKGALEKMDNAMVEVIRALEQAETLKEKKLGQGKGKSSPARDNGGDTAFIRRVGIMSTATERVHSVGPAPARDAGEDTVFIRRDDMMTTDSERVYRVSSTPTPVDDVAFAPEQVDNSGSSAPGRVDSANSTPERVE
jgi:PTH1 family peptidyl-tRNA hydrolase